MPKIVAAAHALPPHCAAQTEVREVIGELFGERLPGPSQLRSILANSRIDRRHFMRPLGWYLSAPSRVDANRIYQTEGLELLFRAARSLPGLPPGKGSGGSPRVLQPDLSGEGPEQKEHGRLGHLRRRSGGGAGRRR